MANIALIDFPADTLGSLAAQHPVTAFTTRWNNGQEDLRLADNTQLVFVNAAYNDMTSLALHTGVHQTLRSVVDRDGAVFVFVGKNCTHHHVYNLVGMPTVLQLGDTPQLPAHSTSPIRRLSM
jgi:hypothetical protein